MGERTLPAGILDANGIIGLAKADCLLHLSRLFTPIVAPPSVIAEVSDPLSASRLKQALAGGWSIRQPSGDALSRIMNSRSIADNAVLALALDFPGAILVTGDRALSARAARLGIATVSAPHIVQLLAEKQIIPSARACLDRMMARGFGISPELYAAILQATGE